VLPLLRRTFGAFPAPHRRAIGERVRRWDSAAPDSPEPVGPHPRGDVVLPTVALLLGGGDGSVLDGDGGGDMIAVSGTAATATGTSVPKTAIMEARRG